MSLYSSPENKRSDTIDIISYSINLDITDFIGQTISGYTKIRFAPKLNGQNHLRLDLLKMTIDSIRKGTTLLTYTYNDTLLKVNLPLAMNTTDTAEIKVYYHGHPQGDPAGWGGFSFSGKYAYNLGVGFGANPHCYGRVWFPCFDNFVEKSLYDFHILTDTTKAAYCNGQLTADTRVGNKRLRSWAISKPIPSYLASVAVADYTQINWTIPTIGGSVPAILAARPSDTTAMKIGFQRLPNAVAGFENYYGPYVWNRVGYCLVPFGSGAMEHATNIAYPQSLAGNVSYEHSLMAHELSHHWWGDLMTCETQEDMWLNEGMASYSEKLFLEWVYGRKRYLDEVKSIHDPLVKYLHLNESGFRAISGIPHAYTYGDHVYKKGADVAHTLRGYMGDAAFFTGLKYVLQQKAYKNMNSLEFRDLLETSSGQNLHPFFDNWVFNGGWPHFSIDSVQTSGSGPYTSVVYLKQKLFGAPAMYTNVPLELTFMNALWAKELKTATLNGATGSFTFQTNVQPKFTGINVDSKISDAISSEVQTIKTNATYSYGLGRAVLAVSNKGQDSSYIRIEHNFAAPDPVKNNLHNYRLNTQHYWKIDGLLSPGFASTLRLNYDGNKQAAGNSYLDTCLTAINGDSIIVLYRRNAADDWHEVNRYTKFKAAARTGFVTIDTLKLGEYVFANGKSIVIGIDEKKSEHEAIHIYPNPVSESVHVVFETQDKPAGTIELLDVNGKVVLSQPVSGVDNLVSVKELSKGIYIAKVRNHSRVLTSQKIVIE